MGKTAYFDCFSGASGDMVLGALLDLGLPLASLRGALGSLAIDYGAITAERVLRAGVSATKFRASADEGPIESGREEPEEASDHGHVHHHADGEPHHHPHPHHHHGPGHSHGHAGSAIAHRHTGGSSAHGHHSLTEITGYIERSALSRVGKDRAIDLFETLAKAEAAVHDVAIDRIHLHEVGAVDSIIDIVGAVHAMEWLGADEVVVSPLNVGSGTVMCAHGEFPVPAPATARLLDGVPVYAGAVKAELVTPTGALLMTAYARRFGSLPAMRLRQIGYGAGTRDFKNHPNVLRVLVGDAETVDHVERVVVLECEIDDMNPQLFGPLMGQLYAAGALDVFYVAVQMKKNRPGTLVTVVASPERRQRLSDVLFAESTTIGVRYQEMFRDRLDREIRAVSTAVGPIRFKIASRDGRVLNAAPEFEDCARIARERGWPLKDVQATAVQAWVEQGWNTSQLHQE